MQLTRKMIERFIKERNKSPHFSNMQFSFDARHCGFSVSDLPDPVKIGEDHYEWHLVGIGVMTEKYRKLTLRHTTDEEDASKLLGLI